MSEKVAIKSRKIVTPEGLVDGVIVVSNGCIEMVQKGLLDSSFMGKIMDVGNCTVMPGFVDLHIHGVAGMDLHGELRDVQGVSRVLAENGVTAFFPTTAALPLERLKVVLSTLSLAMEEQKRALAEGEQNGAEMLGIHLEGPFLSRKKKGAMVIEHLITPSLDAMEELEEAALGRIARVTVAPEIPGGLELIRYLKKKGCLIAGGHTNATYQETKKGIEAGITVANHMFNAMRSMHHREPGAVGAYLTDDRVACELIGDNIHIHPTVMEIARRCKGLDNLFVISDAVLAAGLPPGEYEFAGQRVTVSEDGKSFLSDGTIAGSTYLMKDCFKNLIETMGLLLEEAVCLTSTNPARIAGISDCKGRLAVGMDADITVLGDNYQVLHTFVKGKAIKKLEKERVK